MSFCLPENWYRYAAIRTSKLLTPNTIVVVPWLESNGTSKGKPSHQYRLVVGIFVPGRKPKWKATH